MSLKKIASIQFHAIIYMKAVLLWMWFDKTNSMGIFKIQMLIFLNRIFWQWHRWLSPRQRLTPTLHYSTEVDEILYSAINIILIMKDMRCIYKSNSDSTLFSVTSGFSGLLLCSKYQDNAPNTINHDIAETAATVITHTTKTCRLTMIIHRSETFTLDWCLVNVNLRGYMLSRKHLMKI